MQAPASSSQLDDSPRTLWAGSLPPYVDETFLYNLFARALPPNPSHSCQTLLLRLQRHSLSDLSPPAVCLHPPNWLLTEAACSNRRTAQCTRDARQADWAEPGLCLPGIHLPPCGSRGA